MKNLVYTFLFCFTFISVNISYGQSQKAKIVFDNESHDFGKIKEDGGRVIHKFLFTNTGAEPLNITRVNTSCECATPDWSRGEVPAGGKGYVSVAFDPIRRPGTFNKTITVRSNAENSQVTLRIKGYVNKKAKTIEQIYRHKMGNIRLKQKSLHFAEILKSTEQRKTNGFTSSIDNF